MKKVYLLLLLCCLNLTDFATTWYSAPAGGDPSVLTSWWDSPGGTGLNPSNFTTATDSFVVQSNMLMTAAAWTVDAPVNLLNGSIQDNGVGAGFGGFAITLNFHGNLYMNNNSFITSNYTMGMGMFGTGGIGGTVAVNLYAGLYMTGTAYFNNAYAASFGFGGGTTVTFANTASTLASPQPLSGVGSQAGSAYTNWTVNNRVYVQLVDSFNTEPPTTGGFGGPTPYPFTVNAGGFLDCQAYDFNGPGQLTISNGATMYTASTAGINGNLDCTGTNSLGTGGIYIFNGTLAQITGTLLPATLTAGGGGGGAYAGSVNIDNPAGVTLSQSTTFSNGTTLTLTSGELTLNANNVTMGATATIGGAFSNTADIVTNGTGQVRRDFAAVGSFTFPVGDASNYSPITIDLTAGTLSGAYIGVTVNPVEDPHNANSTNYLNRYWNIVLSGITTPSYEVTSAQYAVTDVVGSEANMSAGKYPNALPWVKYGAANTVSHTLTTGATGITNLNADFTGINTTGPSFTVTASMGVCSGVSTDLEILSSTADAPATYRWAPSAGLSGVAGTSVAATPTVTTTYTVTITDGNGFTSTQTTTLTVNPNPDTIAGGGSGVLCLGQTLSLTDGVSGGTWSSTNTSSAPVDPSGNVTAADLGTATIAYTLAGGCNATLAVSVVSTPPSISGSNQACTGATTSLSDVGTGTWSSSSTARATIDASSGVLTGVTPGTTVVSYALGPGCVISTTVTVNPAPDAITGPANACIGIVSSLADATTGGIWSSNNTSFATVSATGGVTGVSTGSVIINYTTPSNGCTIGYPMGVVSLPPPITGTTSICAGFTSALADGIAGGTWSSGNTALAVVNSATGLVTGVSPGTPSIIYTLLPGCFTAVPFTVNSSGTPTIAIAVSPGATVCPGTLAHFSITSTAFTGGSPTVDWYKDGMFILRGTTYSYVPVDGDIVYSVLHSTFACARIDSAISNNFTLSTTPVVVPVVTIVATNSIAGSGQNDTLVATLSSATPTPQYQWYKNDHIIPGATNVYYVANEDTVGSVAYNCVVNAGDACNTTGISNRLYVTFSDVSVKQIAADGAELSIAPNPNKGTFTMTLQSDNNEPVQVVITNILGEKVREFTAATNTATNVNLNVATGIYLLSASTNSGRYVARIVVN